MARQDERVPFVAALARARSAAYPPGQDVGQESFMLADEIRRLAHHAGIGPGTAVLDLCCGIAGPGRLITAESGNGYLGVDSSAEAVEIATRLAGDLPCRFVQGDVPPLPAGRFDVVLLLETLLAFPDKAALLRAVAGALDTGGRFACTVEAGRPLSEAERQRMPDADTVWPVEMEQLTELLGDAGLVVTRQEECTAAHATTAAALLRSYRADEADIAARVGPQAAADLVAAHELWVTWLGSGRIRKFAVVAEKR
ncbi:class I SAM-dependent methyltransferase [Modestobacter sp. VKM Ac-2985]|uniref:class I SAM-dependent methyltransferase n=1 Tax=Modestobacter sp. VKM Ac-2985 TaxID=3004139 RepID=UPI0022AB598A|nr:class I SAM-dependent methyltransferase [Modestobacter sp. VKM Ac-2985]MCZ2836985.1 class I SAM-dependent methyltransferase [Modestobacter sp. VKM Ac-2985]